MTKKRKAADLSGADAAQPLKNKVLDKNVSHTDPAPTENVKKSKKRKTSDVSGAEVASRLDNNTSVEPPSDKSRKKSMETNGTQPEQPLEQQNSGNDISHPQTASAQSPSEPTRGEKRQAKSERPRRTKKGKIVHTREMALERIRLVKEKKKERKERLRLARLVPAPTAATTTTTSIETDALAAGSDFVPLFAEDTNPTPVNLENGAPPKLIMLPKRSKKGLTKADRKEKAESNRVMQKERTAKRKEKKLRKLSVVNPDPLPEDTDPSTLLPPPIIHTSTSTTTTTADQKSQHRFILFIGNLPFTTTTESLQKHFESLQPFTVRHSTDKATKKSKGFAFLEFEHYDKMKTCLKLYHHSYFNPEDAGADPVVEDDGIADQRAAAQATKKTKDKGRRINVELTAGGGGKGKERKEKIKKKNQKLSEQRERKMAKEKAEKLKEQETQGKPTPRSVAATGTNAQEDNRGDIHPSRMSRVKG